MFKRLLLVTAAIFGLLVAVNAATAHACGGFFCQNSPVDQAGERIVFSVNDDGTITSLIEIQYTGSAADFSWILPVPSALSADDLAVPEDGAAVFAELHDLTDVQILPSKRPDCADDDRRDILVAADASGAEGVDIFASGEVGPFGFDVLGSEDPEALIRWLRDNDYRVEPTMVPLIDVYVEERFAFVAMRLLDGQSSEAITPIEITYTADKPAIPLRLTAVAASNNMPIYTWIFAEAQAVPVNFAHMEIATEEITLFSSGGHNYQDLVTRRANALSGRAFITEFAGPSGSLDFTSDYLQKRSLEHPYLTRLATNISPDEMTVDPVFAFDSDQPDVSNVRDATDLNGLYDCQREGEDEALVTIDFSDAIDPEVSNGLVAATTPPAPDRGDALRSALIFTVLVVALIAGALVFSTWKAGAPNR